MARFATLLFLAIALFASTALAGSRNHKRFGFGNTIGCEALLATRAATISAMTGASAQTENELDYFLVVGTFEVLNAAIAAQSCCANTAVQNFFVSKYASGLSGQVCGYDFNTYATPAAACVAGIYHSGACFGGYTNLPCYLIPGTDPSNGMSYSAECALGLVEEVVATLHIFEQNPDAVMIQSYPLCNQANSATNPDFMYRHSEGFCNNLGLAPIPPSAAAGIPPGVDFRWSGALNNLFTHEAPTLPSNPTAYIQAGPNPRELSNALFTQATPIPNANGVNGLIMAHVNFFIHDFMNHKNDDWNNPIAIPVPITDPVWGLGTSWGNNVNWLTTTPVMLIPGTESDLGPAGQPAPSGSFPYRRDQTTSWFDISQIYGSTTAATMSLRTLVGGQMQMQQTSVGLLLPNAPPQAYVVNPFLSGDYRVNFHPGLTAIHTLWTREHNRIANTLNAFSQGTMSDEQLFQTARMILAATVIKIHTLEWTNALALSPADQAVTAYLYSQFGCPQPLEFQQATHVVPEEFVAVYKWHSFVQPMLQLRSLNGAPLRHPVDYVAQFQDTTLIRTYGIEPVLVGLGMSPVGTMRFNNLAPGLQNIKHPYLLKPSNVPFNQPHCVLVPGLDFAVIDIVRDRERGILKYNALRALVALGNLPAAVNFDDLADTPAQAFALASFYRWNINSVDAYVGFHGEHLLPGQGFPVTVAAAFVPFVIARAQLDRFYTDNFDLLHYTGYGIERLAYVDFAQVLCDNANICNIPDRTQTFFIWNQAQMGQNTITPNTLGNPNSPPPSTPVCQPTKK